jgi:predicted Fe-Mo cluster-binding NifX family protein
MKIAVTSTTKTIDSLMDERFGRASGFIIFDTETGGYEHIDNTQNLNSTQGAGIQAAKSVINTGATVLITGNVGPKAYAALAAAGVEVFLKKGGTAMDAVGAYLSGALAKAAEANAKAHW